MRVVEISKHGGPDCLKVVERPDPGVKSGQVRVEVEAAGVNFADVMARLGFYPDAPKTPCVVGYEVSGQIVEVGNGVDASRVGEKVMAGTRFGGYAEQVVVDSDNAIPVPDGIGTVAAAAIPVNYSTAWAALVRYGSLQPGERLLIHAAAGGVGIAATQIAKDSGAEVWGTASPSKHEAIKANGVQHPIDYTVKGWEKGLPDFDLVIDAVGGSSFKRSYELLRAGGRLVCFGASSVVSGEGRNLVQAGKTILTMPKFNLSISTTKKSILTKNLLNAIEK
mgnify:CR=1 FL=1